jgi:hypothetical protein
LNPITVHPAWHRLFHLIFHWTHFTSPCLTPSIFIYFSLIHRTTRISFEKYT